MNYLGSIDNPKSLINREYINDIVAKEYDSTKTYSIGNYAIHNGEYFICSANINIPEIWNDDHWKKTLVGKEIANVKQNLNYNSYNLLSDMSCNNGTSGGLTYTWNGYTCIVSAGTSTSYSANVLISKASIPEVVRGSQVYVKYKTTNNNVRLRIIFFDENDTELSPYVYCNSNRIIPIPDNAISWNVVIFITSGIVLTSDVFVSDIAILNVASNSELSQDLLGVTKYLNSYDSFLGRFNFKSDVYQGITYNWNNKICTISGQTSSNNISINLCIPTEVLPKDVVTGTSYRVKYTSTNPVVMLRIIWYTLNDSIIRTDYFSDNKTITVPQNAAKWNVAIFINSNVSLSEAVIVKDIAFLNAETNLMLSEQVKSQFDNSFHSRDVIPNGTDLDTVLDVGSYVIQSGYNYTHSPVTAGILLVIPATSNKSLVLQLVTTSTGKFFMRTSLLGSFSNRDWVSVFCTQGIIPNGTNLDDVRNNGAYVIQSGYSYTNSPIPSTHGAQMLVFKAATNVILQLAYDNSVSGTLYIRASVLGVFGDWGNVSGEIVNNNYYNTYQTDNYENTYNITCTPTITTDTNNYLASTNDTTDRTGDIQTMLNTTGVCRLGPGAFYTTGIEIPNMGALIGSGKSTRLILDSAVTSGYAVRLKTYSTIRDIYLQGSTTDITPNSTVGTRHGILFEGTADSESPQTYYLSYITGCLIRNFAGGGITCYNTGLSPLSSLVVSDVQIVKCDAGINVSYFSEFHRFTNVSCTQCYYGCINNGGNNIFVNCDFSGNKQALLIDDRTGQSRNNTHGTYSACTFHHSDNVYADGHIVSDGVGIQILGAKLSERFIGCLIGYSKVEIDDAAGIQFANCYFGSMADITVTNSKLVTFDSCQFTNSSSSPLIQSNNISLLFNNCYLRSTGEVWNPMS